MFRCIDLLERPPEYGVELAWQQLDVGRDVRPLSVSVAVEEEAGLHPVPVAGRVEGDGDQLKAVGSPRKK